MTKAQVPLNKALISETYTCVPYDQVRIIHYE
jgi:hypothetical protein